MDPLDQIRSICDDQPHDALTKIAAVLGSVPVAPAAQEPLTPRTEPDDAPYPFLPDGWIIHHDPKHGYMAQNRSRMGQGDWLPTRQAATACAWAMFSAQPSAQDREDAQVPDWMTCESRGPIVVNSLKYSAEKLRRSEKRCRGAYKKASMGVPLHYLADAYGEAAVVFETRLKAIDAARAAKEE